MIGGARTRSRKGGRRTRRGGNSVLRKMDLLPALLTGLVLSQGKRKGRKSRRGGRKSRRGSGTRRA